MKAPQDPPLHTMDRLAAQLEIAGIKHVAYPDTHFFREVRWIVLGCPLNFVYLRWELPCVIPTSVGILIRIKR